MTLCVSPSILTGPYLDFALELVKESKEILRSSFQKGESFKGKIETKSDGSPVSALDREVELLFRKRIREKFPEHFILGEEFGAYQAQEKGESGFLWVIDPIDGTKSFISGNPFFGTLVALLYKGEAILGVMDMPLLDECYWGEKSKASFRQDLKGAHKITTRSCSDLAQALLRTTGIEYFSQQKEERDKALFNDLKKLCRESVYGGDCYCYASLACGLTDIVLEVGLAPYDFFALIPLIEGAGGRITDWQGRPLSLDTKKGDVLACGDTRLHQLALECIKSPEDIK